MKNDPNNHSGTLEKIFVVFQKTISIILSILLGLIIILSLVALVSQFYRLFLLTFVPGQAPVVFEDYQDLFGKVMVVIISIEFLKIIMEALKPRKIDTIVQDVALVSALAVGHEIIIMDYTDHEPYIMFALAVLLIAIGVFYFLIKTDSRGDSFLRFNRKRNSEKEIVEKQPLENQDMNHHLSGDEKK